MKTQRIPILAVPAQSLNVNLGGQRCKIDIRQNAYGVFLSLVCNGAQVVQFRICRDRVKLVRSACAPFAGNLVFIDAQGLSDPDYTGLGSRYQLVYTV